MSVLLLSLVFPFSSTSLAQVKTRTIQQEEHWYGCGVDAMDIQSKNRFKVCGGKKIFVPAYDGKDAGLCRDKKVLLLDLIIASEKKHNHCELAEDCIAGEVGRVHYHVNKSAIKKVSALTDAAYSEVKKACLPESGVEGWSMNAVHKKDSRNVLSYTCEKKVCIPHYKGNLLDWSEGGRRDWHRERQKAVSPAR